MRRARATRGSRDAGDAGFTLVELAVALGLLALVLGLVVPLLTVTSSAAQLSANTELATAAGAHALEVIETEVGSASSVCLIAPGAAAPAPGACPASALGAPASGVQVTTSAFHPASATVIQWWLAGGSGGTPGQLMAQQWPSGSPGAATTSVVAGSSGTGARACSIAAGPGGLFGLTQTSSGMSVLTISLVATCGSGPHAATVPMSTSTAALDTTAGS